jgi:hypothetical protein
VNSDDEVQIITPTGPINFLFLRERVQSNSKITAPNATAGPSTGANEEASIADSEPEVPAVSIKDRTKDLDAFFHPAEKIGGKPRRACMLCK